MEVVNRKFSGSFSLGTVFGRGSSAQHLDGRQSDGLSFLGVILLEASRQSLHLCRASRAAGRSRDREGQGSSSGNATRGSGRGRGAGSGAAYTSAIAVDVDGQRQYIQMTATTLVGIAASDGKFLWRYDKAANGNGINCTTPLFFDGMVFAASAYGAGGGLVKLTKDDNGTAKADEVWFSKRMQNHHGGIVYLDGCLYGANGGLEGGALICLDFKTGEVLWDERGKRRALKGSIALADGQLYYRTETGTLLLIEPSRKEYIERGRIEQPDRSNSPAWSHPVIANGKLYVRDQDLLFCYDISAK